MALEFNKEYHIKKIHFNEAHGGTYARMIDLGLMEGMKIKIIRRLQQQGPWVVQADTLYLALRDEEFSMLELG
ncbi:MAG: ferrous iron transport protein A [Bdellovibrionaceae bacterium]|nr:ferrous iron transport protein A [Pseudobdellovibrionaceae bacterium]NUM59452.1 ferrous iron transport protein A [Pseudobdellovibrionaceae bacterium]